MINFKPYLLATAAAFAIRREWRMLELAWFATIAIYLVSWACVGSGSLLEILENTTNWVKVTGTDVVSEVFYTTSFNSLFGVIDRGFPIFDHVPSEQYEQFRSFAFSAMVAAQAVAVLALGANWLQPKASSLHRLTLILLLLSLTSRSPGGYTEILVVFLVFLEPWQRPAQILAIVIAYLISIPYEWIVSYLPNINTASWITGEAVTGRFGIGVGQLLRPLGLLVILLALSLDTLGQAIRDHRLHRPALGLALRQFAT
jgi:hypothetical protein